mgnify:CR=1 FL=1
MRLVKSVETESPSRRADLAITRSAISGEARHRSASTGGPTSTRAYRGGFSAGKTSTQAASWAAASPPGRTAPSTQRDRASSGSFAGSRAGRVRSASGLEASRSTGVP